MNKISIIFILSPFLIFILKRFSKTIEKKEVKKEKKTEKKENEEDSKEKKIVYLDGETLSLETLYEIGNNTNIEVRIHKDAQSRINESRDIIDDFIKKGETKYGINTGFGNFAETKIDSDKLLLLQKNLITSHAIGVGPILELEKSRRLVALRINALCKGKILSLILGNSGIRLETVQKLVDSLNKNCISEVPSKGTVGASGDLAPLAHVALGLIGEGNMFNPKTNKYESAEKVLKDNDLEPIVLEAKEGILIIN
jgi:histidine ammonia-lyase